MPVPIRGGDIGILMIANPAPYSKLEWIIISVRYLAAIGISDITLYSTVVRITIGMQSHLAAILAELPILHDCLLFTRPVCEKSERSCFGSWYYADTGGNGKKLPADCILIALCLLEIYYFTCFYLRLFVYCYNDNACILYL